ncbi:hypothetical protein ACIA8O_06840 [Kitasatospora sp. NPDC051853]|uniref:hypothetical protein n=1 Tax=Kitasatospora sp. NPDC051853 TaxID=3364058 RepID=UPI003793A7B2
MTGHQEPPRDAIPTAFAAATAAPADPAPADAPPASAVPTAPAAKAEHRLPTVWTRTTGLLAALSSLGYLLSVALTPWQPSVRPLPLALLAATAVSVAAWVVAARFAPAAPAPAPPPRASWWRAARHAVVAGLSAGAALSLFAPLGPTAGRVCLWLILLTAATTLLGSRVHQSRARLAAVNRDLRLLAAGYLGAWPAAWTAYHLLRPGDGPLPVADRLGQLLFIPSVGLMALTGLLALGVALHRVFRRHDN